MRSIGVLAALKHVYPPSRTGNLPAPLAMHNLQTTSVADRLSTCISDYPIRRWRTRTWCIMVLIAETELYDNEAKTLDYR